MRSPICNPCGWEAAAAGSNSYFPTLRPCSLPGLSRARTGRGLPSPPAAPSSLSPAPSDPPVPQGTLWEVRISAEFSRQVSELVFLLLPPPPPPPPPASPLRPPPPPLGEPAEQRAAAPLRSPPAARTPARPPRQRRPRHRRTAACGPRGAAEPGRRQPAAPPGRSAPSAGTGEPMVPGTATCSRRRRACLPGAELSPARSRGGAD